MSPPTTSIPSSSSSTNGSYCDFDGSSPPSESSDVSRPRVSTDQELRRLSSGGEGS
eukprot:CAMPEP_0205910932 /NCGR_PEP_ID=MMETSP1325-20131115/4798_1 /ASSEMBLY_ACC=CAM_ASM_000708 /TAXON_ID=236786 /ORGANISM="Florenciella sp., Strain RCC1007" /LENGTH=55 /DNA_ID=CAMNT_0053277371 /DNA_START=20 /DNA_END=184 /DNA_ORIENTATION=-